MTEEQMDEQIGQQIERAIRALESIAGSLAKMAERPRFEVSTEGAGGWGSGGGGGNGGPADFGGGSGGGPAGPGEPGSAGYGPGASGAVFTDEQIKHAYEKLVEAETPQEEAFVNVAPPFQAPIWKRMNPFIKLK